ncbi:JAB domain-containing protein [Megamonas funiformis]|uniref:JAB domain-containing protein n=1 Tax=Megamonas funiformis TaxID=437897 RepID=UPI0026DD8F4B|nr:DNA repair protein RadC [Megamonas funiformis]
MKKDYELLSILLGLQISDDLRLNSLEDILQSPRAIHGIGQKKQEKIYALKEILERLLKLDKKQKITINTPKDIEDILIPQYRYATQENFIIVLLNAKNNIISIEDIFKGSIDTSIAEPKEIFREALKYPTSAIILAHNHPSGDTTPSIEDIYVTKRIVEAGKILGIRILDHIIIGDNNFFSLKQNGLIEKES